MTMVLGSKVTLAVVSMVALLSILSIQSLSKGLERWKPDEISCNQFEERHQEFYVPSNVLFEATPSLNSSTDTIEEVEPEPISPLLPRRIITVFGLESSGTTIVAKTLAKLADVTFREGSRRYESGPRTLDRALEISHISQPWGWHCERDVRPPVLPVLYPGACGGSMSQDQKVKSRSKNKKSFDPPSDLLRQATPQCTDLGITDSKQKDKAMLYPIRYFINITSHVEWYRSRGVEATAVIVLRDKTIGHYARYLGHCGLEDEVNEDEKVGLNLIQEALDRLPSMYPNSSTPPVVMVQYESLLLLGNFYLKKLLRQLRLPIDERRMPEFKNGNEKYIKDYASLYKQKQESKFVLRKANQGGKLGKRLRHGTDFEDRLINPMSNPHSSRRSRTGRGEDKLELLNELRSRNNQRAKGLLDQWRETRGG